MPNGCMVDEINVGRYFWWYCLQVISYRCWVMIHRNWGMNIRRNSHCPLNLKTMDDIFMWVAINVIPKRHWNDEIFWMD